MPLRCSSSIDSSFIRSGVRAFFVANRAANPSTASRISYISSTLARSISATTMRPPSEVLSNPSDSSCRKASRTGVRLISNRSHISFSPKRLPAGISPERSRSRSLMYACSPSDKSMCCWLSIFMQPPLRMLCSFHAGYNTETAT